MIKKSILILSMLLIAQTAFGAVCKKDLNTDFFNRFNDNYLNFYIDQALENNHELKKAGQVVEQYRQQAKYSFGNELPSFSVSAQLPWHKSTAAR